MITINEATVYSEKLYSRGHTKNISLTLPAGAPLYRDSMLFRLFGAFLPISHLHFTMILPR